MHLDSLTDQERVSKGGLLLHDNRFEKNRHNDLINKRAAVYAIDGTFLIVPIKESVITQESLNERLRAVKEQIQTHIGVQTERIDHSVDDLQRDQEMKREYGCSEKSLKVSGRSKPPSVLCGIRLCVKPGPGPDAR